MRMWRLSAYIAFKAAGGKGSIEQFQPLDSDRDYDKDTFAQPTKDWWDKMMKKQEQVNEQILKKQNG